MIESNLLNNIDVEYHVKELEEKIKREFIEVLKNNVIDPYKFNVVFYGENFVFVYVCVKRFKHIIRFKFEVYRRKEFGLYSKRSIGTVYVSVRV